MSISFVNDGKWQWHQPNGEHGGNAELKKFSEFVQYIYIYIMRYMRAASFCKLHELAARIVILLVFSFFLSYDFYLLSFLIIKFHDGLEVHLAFYQVDTRCCVH